MIKNIKLFLLIFILFVLTRLPGLGNDIFNTDVWKWKQRSYDFGTGVFTGDFQKTLQKYHPGVTLMWVGAIGVKVYNLYYRLSFSTNPLDNNVATVFGLHVAQKLLLVCAIGVVIGLSYLVLRRLIGGRPALIAVMFLVFEPYYVALTRVFHLEGLMSTFMAASALLLYDFLVNEKKKSLVLSGILAGLAILTKTSAIYLIPFCVLGLAVFGKVKFNLRYILKSFLIWFGVNVVVFIALWPVMWVQPLNAVSELYRGVSEIGVETDHAQVYFGKYVSDPGPLFYAVVLLLRSSPWLIFGLLGIALSIKKFPSKEKHLILYLIVFGVLYILQSSIPSKKLDRYILPSLLAFSLASGVYFAYLFGKLQETRKIPVVASSAISLFILVVQLAYLHPEYLSYFNPMFGGLRVGAYVLEPKWMIGIRQINNYFLTVKQTDKLSDAPADQSYEEIIKNKTVDTVLSVAFPEKYYTQIWPFFRRNNEWAVINDLAPLAKYAKYYVYPVWDDRGLSEDRFDIRFYGQIKLRGVPLYNVYKRL